MDETFEQWREKLETRFAPKKRKTKLKKFKIWPAPLAINIDDNQIEYILPVTVSDDELEAIEQLPLSGMPMIVRNGQTYSIDHFDSGPTNGTTAAVLTPSSDV